MSTKIKTFLVTQGYTGQYNDALYSFLRAQGQNGALPDMLYGYTSVQFGTDNVTDGLKAWEDSLP